MLRCILAIWLLISVAIASDCIVQSLRAPVTHGVVAPSGLWDSYSNYLALAYDFEVATNSYGKIVDVAPGGSATGTLSGATWVTCDAPRVGSCYNFDGSDNSGICGRCTHALHEKSSNKLLDL